MKHAPDRVLLFRRLGQFLWLVAGVALVLVALTIVSQKQLPEWALIVATIAVTMTTFGVAVGSYVSASREQTQALHRIEAAEEVATREPERAKPAWDVARVTLEAYFTRNLRQIDMIFWLSVLVLVVGFAVMAWGISTGLADTNRIEGARLATGAGALTEFVAGTFILIYRTAIGQAVKYIVTLERINSVGMAMQILDTMSDPTEKDLTSKTKAELVKLLIKQVATEKAEPKTNLLRIISGGPHEAE